MEKIFSVGGLNQAFGQALGGLFTGFAPLARGMTNAELREMLGRGIANVYPSHVRRPERPWAYWQFKNGKLAPIGSEIPFVEDAYVAWDRGLGARVVYAK